MFQHIHNYSSTITQSEKFYYDNFEYFNCYENLEKDYKDDLSKMIFHCNRKSIPNIIVYNDKKQNMRTPHQRFISCSESYEKFYKSILYSQTNKTQKITMEQFIDTYLNIWIQNNYAENRSNSDFSIKSLSRINDERYSAQNQLCPFNMVNLSLQDLKTIFGKLSEVNQNKIAWLEQQYANQDNSGIFNLQCQVCFELFADYVLTKKFDQVSSPNFQLLYQFIVQVNRLMWQILNNQMRCILILAQPKIQYLYYLMHPLVLPITIFLKYDHLQFTNPQQRLLTGQNLTEKPKIVFINLDGKQSAHNIRNIRALQENFLYISLFNEPSWFKKKHQEIKNTFSSQEEIQVEFKNLCQVFSELLLKQYLQNKNQPQKNCPQILLFPLNSTYLQKLFYRTNIQHTSNKKFPVIKTARQINFIFETIIYEKIRQYAPTMIFISYNGQLEQINNLNQENARGISGTHVFADIIRNCSIIADHKVVLFPNFTSLFQFNQSVYQDVEQEMNDDDGKIKCALQFYEKYYRYDIQDFNDIFHNSKSLLNSTLAINNQSYVMNTVKQEPLFECLSLFLQYGPGNYKMQDGLLENSQTPNWKYQISNQYEYLKLLQDVAEFPFMKNSSIRKIAASQLEELYLSYGLQEIRENQKQIQSYDNLLTTIISEFLCQKISQQKLKQILQKRLYYRFQALIEQIKQNQLCKYDKNIELDLYSLLKNHFQNIKLQMLLQNMQNYKIKKHYYAPQNRGNNDINQAQCLRFYMNQNQDAMETEDLPNNDESNQLLLEKYSQIFIQTGSQLLNHIHNVFIINYKSPQTNRHMILAGTFNSFQAEKKIKMEEVKQTDLELSEQVQQYFQSHFLEEQGRNLKQDIVYLNYNHCFCGQNLYLYWPLQYNLKQEARCRLLDIEYQPKRVFKMLKISPFQQKPNKIIYKYEKVIYDCKNQATDINILPRWGCTSYAVSENQFLIFGGIFQNELDYLALATNINFIQITPNQGVSSFSIKARNKQRNYNVQCSLKPKINYKVQQQNQKNKKMLKICGGYGRYNTNFYNLASYQQFLIDLQNFIPQKSKISNRRIVETEKPIVINKIGKYPIATNSSNPVYPEQKFSDELKQKFIFSEKAQNKANSFKPFSFIDDNFHVFEFKTHKKKQYLFGFLQNIRQRIYTKCWSPQLYIVSDKSHKNCGFKPNVINLSLKTQKSSNYITPYYLMPRQQDIMTLCIQQDKIYLISNCPIINNSLSSSGRYMVYQGWLGNISQVMSKRQIQMNNKFTFSSEISAQYMHEKSIFVNQGILYVVGGQSNPVKNILGFNEPSQNLQEFQRQDYILVEQKNKYLLRTKKITSNGQNLDMPNSVVVKTRKYYFLYSVVLEEKLESDQMSQIDELDLWKLKIEKHQYDIQIQNDDVQQVCGIFKLYFYNYIDKQVQRYPLSYLEEPKLVSITPYKRFLLVDFRLLIAKIIWGLKKVSKILKFQEIKNLYAFLQSFMNTKDVSEDLLNQKIIQNFNIFEQYLNFISHQEVTQQNINNTEYSFSDLLKDLRNCYHLIFKLVLERTIMLPPNQNTQNEQFYRFIVEDKTSNRVKYIAIGELGTTRLNFFRIRFSYEIILCANHEEQNSFFYHPTILTCLRFQNQSLRNNLDNCCEYSQEQQIKMIKSYIKN